MPYKNGPNKTKRYFNSSDGRYAKNPNSQPILFVRKRKKDCLEKITERMQIIKNKAKNSRDVGLYPLYRELSKLDPLCVADVNKAVYENGQRKTDLDVVTDKLVIEIKSGRPRNKTKQYLVQKEIAERKRLRYIVYAPNMRIGTQKECEKLGIKVVRTIEEVLEEQKK